MLESKDPAPVGRLANAKLADRARSAILEAIMSEQFVGRLPPEETLASMLDVSRTTIRSALQSLEQDGIITRKRALGTTINAHVRPSTLALQRLVGFDGLLREEGYDVRTQVTWQWGEAPAAFADVFPALEGEECLLTEKSYFAEKALAIWIRDAIPRRLIKREDFDDPLPASLFEFTRTNGSKKVDHAVVDIVSMVRRADNDTRLVLDVHEPYTRLHETHYSSAGEPIAYSIVDVDNAFVNLQVFRRA
ncbi:MAG TPA: GntR family transcriptional regulator [Solirubrobacteraceae bacterium]|jgi:GntR family transcriptional regulator|nr:GntR family transcriptional regulator [Solirubrobacteraceae bacterium]